MHEENKIFEYEIAYYEERNYHTEILGTFAEYFHKKNIKITVFNDGDKSDFISFYRKYYGYTVKPTSAIIDTDEHKKYKYIIIGTRDESLKLDKIYEEISDKCVLIYHLLSNIKNDHRNNIVLTPLNITSKSRVCLLPIYGVYTNINKNKCKNIYALIGRFKDGNRDTENIELWKNMFQNSELVHFVKPAESMFIYKNNERNQDFIYVATESQKTKNRSMFLKFLEYCEANEMKARVINIGKIDTDITKFKFVTVTHYDIVSPDLLVELYNSSKINLVLSGRDAYPRVIAESLACGCYNVALDTLSDGKYMYNGFFGTILSYPNINKTYDKNTKSLCYEQNKMIFDDIYNFKNKDYDHENISIRYINMYTYKLSINCN